jgi:tetratricopeptide (TPR) repeat protein
MNRKHLSLSLLLLALLLAACASPSVEEVPIAALTTATTVEEATVERATATMAPTFTIPATATLAPTSTETPEATETPEPTETPEATETPEPTETPEATSTPEATATLEATATPEVQIAAAPPQFYLENVMHEYQRLNNCGPTSAAMALSYYGLPITQYDIAPMTKGADTDKNVSPAELVAYMESQGMRGRAIVGGDLATVQTLVANNIPVVLEQWLERHDDPLTGHYRMMRGYDQAAGVVIVNDSYTGPNVRYNEEEFDRWWRAFNRLYIPVYRPEQEALVRSIVGEDQWEHSAMWESNLRRSEEEVATRGDVYDWFNLGTARLRMGDPAGAVAAFEESIALGIPERLLWDQFAIFEAYNAAGQYERTLDLTRPYVGTLVEEIHYLRGQALEALGRSDEAIAEYQTARSLNPRYLAPQEALTRLGVNG